jgi:hypothetical protein
MLSKIAQASLRSELLIDFNTLVDTEIGLFELIRREYLDPDVFNVELLNSDIKKLLSLLITREEVNPLYLIANDNIDRKDLDDYYKEFMETKYIDILIYSVTTEMERLIALSKSEPSVHVTFLCNSKAEIDLLKFINGLKDIKYHTILSKDINDVSIYTSYYFKYITDDLSKYIFKFKNYYFSSYKLNFDNEMKFIKREYIDKINSMGGEIYMMDLYNRKFFEGEE